MIPAPIIISGSRCLIRIAAAVVHEDAQHGYTIDYMGARFLAPAGSFRSWVDDRMATFELVGIVTRSTGNASYLVSHQGHALRMHVQQIRALEEAAI